MSNLLRNQRRQFVWRWNKVFTISAITGNFLEGLKTFQETLTDHTQSKETISRPLKLQLQTSAWFKFILCLKLSPLMFHHFASKATLSLRRMKIFKKISGLLLSDKIITRNFWEESEKQRKHSLRLFVGESGTFKTWVTSNEKTEKLPTII